MNDLPSYMRQLQTYETETLCNNTVTFLQEALRFSTRTFLDCLGAELDFL
jgi:hypothetical protein